MPEQLPVLQNDRTLEPDFHLGTARQIALDALRPGFAVTGHTRTGAVPGKPQISWVFAAVAAENAQKT